SAQSTHSLMPEKPMATPEIISSGRQKHAPLLLTNKGSGSDYSSYGGAPIFFSPFAIMEGSQPLPPDPSPAGHAGRARRRSRKGRQAQGAHRPGLQDPHHLHPPLPV
ncbi:hypothetical protein PTTG_25576, partial [Puccinia triticina 1-1 BBBD Race 1]